MILACVDDNITFGVQKKGHEQEKVPILFFLPDFK